MKIILQGQLAVTSGLNSISHELAEKSSVEELIHQLAGQLPKEAKSLLVKDDGSIRNSLFVAIDNEHVRDYSTLVSSEVRELILMPPMAGG